MAIFLIDLKSSKEGPGQRPDSEGCTPTKQEHQFECRGDSVDYQTEQRGSEKFLVLNGKTSIPLPEDHRSHDYYVIRMNETGRFSLYSRKEMERFLGAKPGNWTYAAALMGGVASTPGTPITTVTTIDPGPTLPASCQNIKTSTDITQCQKDKALKNGFLGQSPTTKEETIEGNRSNNATGGVRGSVVFRPGGLESRWRAIATTGLFYNQQFALAAGLGGEYDHGKWGAGGSVEWTSSGNHIQGVGYGFLKILEKLPPLAAMFTVDPAGSFSVQAGMMLRHTPTTDLEAGAKTFLKGLVPLELQKPEKPAVKPTPARPVEDPAKRAERERAEAATRARQDAEAKIAADRTQLATTKKQAFDGLVAAISKIITAFPIEDGATHIGIESFFKALALVEKLTDKKLLGDLEKYLIALQTTLTTEPVKSLLSRLTGDAQAQENITAVQDYADKFGKLLAAVQARKSALEAPARPAPPPVEPRRATPERPAEATPRPEPSQPADATQRKLGELITLVLGAERRNAYFTERGKLGPTDDDKRLVTRIFSEMRTKISGLTDRSTVSAIVDKINEMLPVVGEGPLKNKLVSLRSSTSAHLDDIDAQKAAKEKEADADQEKKANITEATNILAVLQGKLAEAQQKSDAVNPKTAEVKALEGLVAALRKIDDEVRIAHDARITALGPKPEVSEIMPKITTARSAITGLLTAAQNNLKAKQEAIAADKKQAADAKAREADQAKAAEEAKRADQKATAKEARPLAEKLEDFFKLEGAKGQQVADFHLFYKGQNREATYFRIKPDPDKWKDKEAIKKMAGMVRLLREKYPERRISFVLSGDIQAKLEFLNAAFREAFGKGTKFDENKPFLELMSGNDAPADLIEVFVVDKELPKLADKYVDPLSEDKAEIPFYTSIRETGEAIRKGELKDTLIDPKEFAKQEDKRKAEIKIEIEKKLAAIEKINGELTVVVERIEGERNRFQGPLGIKPGDSAAAIRAKLNSADRERCEQLIDDLQKAMELISNGDLKTLSEAGGRLNSLVIRETRKEYDKAVLVLNRGQNAYGELGRLKEEAARRLGIILNEPSRKGGGIDIRVAPRSDMPLTRNVGKGDVYVKIEIALGKKFLGMSAIPYGLKVGSDKNSTIVSGFLVLADSSLDPALFSRALAETLYPIPHAITVGVIGSKGDVVAKAEGALGGFKPTTSTPPKSSSLLGDKKLLYFIVPKTTDPRDASANASFGLYRTALLRGLGGGQTIREITEQFGSKE